MKTKTKMKGILSTLLCYLFFTLSSCMAEEKTLIEKINISLDSSKISGKGWDAFKNAPDIALCVVTLANDQCFLRVSPKKDSRKIHNPLFQKRKYSLCQNSYDCQFELNKPLNKILGLVILDLDAKNNDFVDAAILIDSKEESDLSDEIKKMDERLRNISYKYSQVFSEAEKQRRLKKFPVCKISIDSTSKCKLKQSRIEVN